MPIYAILFCLFSFFNLSSFSAEISDPLSCFSCGAKPADKKLKSCTRCHVAKYCGVDCQGKDWAKHKKECPTKVEADAEKATEQPTKKAAEEKIPDVLEQASAMLSKSFALKDQSKTVSFWQKLDVEKIKEGSLEKFGLRLNSVTGSDFHYNDTILATALMDLALMHSFWQIIERLLHKPVNHEKLLNNIDDAYTILSIRLNSNLRMPDNYFTSVAPKIAPSGFYIAQHKTFFNTYIANRGKAGKFSTINALIALELLDSLEALEKIYSGIALSSRKTSGQTEAGAEFLKTKKFAEVIDREVFGNTTYNLRELSESDFKIVLSFYESHRRTYD